MREILFRGKRVDNGEWVEGLYVCLYDAKGHKSHRIYTGYSETDCGDYYPEWLEVDQSTVGQYTGEEIANKRLFEGDIVEWYDDCDDIWGHSKTHHGRSVVIWDNDNYCWAFRTVDDICPFNDWSWEYCSIIGNIHDNPELLE